jgi:hypothetical protein
MRQFIKNIIWLFKNDLNQKPSRDIIINTTQFNDALENIIKRHEVI